MFYDYSEELNLVSKACFQISFDHGFWNSRNPNDVDIQLSKLMLIVTEVAEAAEEARNSKDDPHRIKIGEELSDVVIRVFDLSVALGIDIGDLIVQKMKKNEGREYMHGKRA